MQVCRIFKGSVYKPLKKINQLRKLADAKQTEVVHLVLAWYLTQEAIDVLIPGAKHSEQVLDNLKTLKVQLTDEEIRQIDQLFHP
ncbi:BH2324 [Halalkalibacterium halodurans C-125]|uniref:BH2324 protein n=1 Tax=Halalkalibacterium halodurans (strain ATCC BAA-125 / DSM 18197 / FERM 7344 / JCM 9153 / C-125) TaxID=272558 RepID=Q9KAG3_HALH5|nr:BH2324 [Halalkalibacterium halodurans C-125]